MESESIHPGAAIALPVPVPSGDLFAHKSSGDVLALLVDSPHTAFGIRDLSRATGHPHRSISSAVDALEAAGFVEVEPTGRKKLVSIARDRLTKPDDPIVQIPQAEFHAPVRELVERLSDGVAGVRGIVLFGSVARGEADRRSDVDCFVLVEGTQASGQQTADEIAADLSETPIDGDRYRFHVLVESVESAGSYGDRLRDVFANGLTLVDSDDLAALKAEVLVDG